MGRYRVVVNNKEHEVTLLARSGSRLSFEVQGVHYDVDVQPLLDQVGAAAPTLRAPARAAASKIPTPAASGAVTAPIPGIVVRILVNVGDSVTIGQPLLVLEAMKMENNIPAPRAGTIKTIHIKAGEQVNNGQELVSLED